MPSDQSPVLPNKFLVIFPARRCAGHPADYYPGAYTRSVALADIGFADLAGAPGNKALFSTAYALYSSPTAAPTNKATLDALAVQMATDFCNWRSQAFDTVLNGAISPDPSALNDEVEWTYTASDTSTRLTSAPLESEPDRYQTQDPAVSGCVDSGGIVVQKLPGIEADIPLANGQSGRALFTIEGGRLVQTFLGSMTSVDGCACQGEATVPNLCLCDPFAPPTVPSTLTLTDSVFGVTTITFGTTIHGLLGWSAQKTVSVTGLATRYCTGNPSAICWGAPAPPSPTTINTYIFYSLYCNPNSPFNLILLVDSYSNGYDLCNPGVGTYGSSTSYLTDVALSNPGCSGVNLWRGLIATTSSYVVNKSVCNKLNVTFTMANGDTTIVSNPYASGANINVAA